MLVVTAHKCYVTDFTSVQYKTLWPYLLMMIHIIGTRAVIEPLALYDTGSIFFQLWSDEWVELR